MRIESEQVKALAIYDAPKLDAVHVVMYDLGPGVGRLIVECYGEAWSGFWGAMGERSIEQFVLSCTADYLAGRMWPAGQRRTNRGEAYLLRIIEAVQDGLRGSQQHCEPRHE